jgi:endonuclease YncB( thermonuclease family)
MMAVAKIGECVNDGDEWEARDGGKVRVFGVDAGGAGATHGDK